MGALSQNEYQAAAGRPDQRSTMTTPTPVLDPTAEQEPAQEPVMDPTAELVEALGALLAKGPKPATRTLEGATTIVTLLYAALAVLHPGFHPPVAVEVAATLAAGAATAVLAFSRAIVKRSHAQAVADLAASHTRSLAILATGGR